jgi:serine/threonine-protein kinase
MATSPSGSSTSRSSFPPLSGVASARGGETVVNPERRGTQLVPDPSNGPSSQIVRCLFPRPEDNNGTDPAPSAAGLQLAHFTIQERIGVGGMGAVFRAMDTRLERIVALKILTPNQSIDAAAVQRFENEARATARLNHDNVARVYFIGEDQGLHFISYEHVTGTNIRDLIRQSGRFTPAEAVNYTLQVASALKHISLAGVVHRDIKPSNIIITENGRAKLVDLGLARKQNDESEDDLTLAGTTLGTFDYISPEQAKDPRNVDVRSDIYSLGCTLYHMLTGEPPYPEGTITQKLLGHQGKQPPDPAKSNPRVPPELSVIVRRMMASDPRKRYATPEQLIRELMQMAGRLGLRGMNPEGLVWSNPGRIGAGFWERHLGWLATAAALLLIVFLLGQFPGLGENNGPSPRADTQENADDAASIAARDDRAGANPNSNNITDGAPGKADDGEGSPTVIPAKKKEPIPFDDDDPRIKQLVGKQPLDPKTDDGSKTPVETPGKKKTDGSPGDADSKVKPRPLSKEKQPSAGPPIVIVSTDGTEPKSFPTLEAACTAASDGDVIELRFNDRRIEDPLRITKKKITIRGHKDFRPLIEFRHKQIPAEGDQIRMITINDGSLDLVNIDLVLPVREHIYVDSDKLDTWAIISLEGPDRVHMQGVTVTIENPADRPATVIELVSGADSNLARMKMMKDGESTVLPKADIRIVGSFVRGNGHLIVTKQTLPARIELSNSACSLNDAVLAVFGNDEMPPENEDLELKLEHMTCLLGDGLIRMDSGTLQRKMLPVVVDARDNIFAASTAASLVSMTGQTDTEDFRRLLRWEGDKNFYDQIETFWSITSDQGTSDFDEHDFDAWKRVWSPLGSQNAGLAWKGEWKAKKSNTVTATELVLDDSTDDNPAVGAASNGSDAGADLKLIPDFPPQLASPRKLPASAFPEDDLD